MIQKIRYSKIGDHDVLFVSSPSSPTSIQTFIIKEELISSAVLELDQNILAWDSVIGSIILLTENHSVECHAFIPGFETKSLACFQKCDILPDFPYSLTKPNISMNPVKKSFTIWESVPGGSTWLLSEIMLAPVWINMDATCQAVIAPFAPGLPEKFYFDEENSAIGFEHVAGYKAWIRTPSDFMVLKQYSQDQESYTCWGEMGMITADEEIYKEWIDKYSTKVMIDGRYVEE